MTKTREELVDLLTPVIETIGAAEWNADLAARLNAAFPPGGETFETLRAACRSGIEDGWMGLEGDDRRKGGRVVEPGPASGGYSIDVVEIADITGPHHRHPGGEVCAVLPVTEGAEFDGNGEGWAVYPPGSDHWPSAQGGRLRVLFFLPDGAIEYTDRDQSLESGSGYRA